MEKRPKLILSTAIMGQVWPEQWKELCDFAGSVLRREAVECLVGLEIVAAFKEPLLSLIMNRVRRVGLAERVETIHGRVDYDMQAVEGRRQAVKGLKILELLAYDFFMAWVGEAYRAAVKFPYAKLLLHSPTLFQLSVMQGSKPRMRRARLVIENDEKIAFPFGEEKLARKMSQLGDALNPVDVFKFAQQKKLAKMVFDTAHFWRSFPDENVRSQIWQQFKSQAQKSKLPIYWHLNHNNSQHFLIRQHGRSFATKHDSWLAQVCQFIGPRVKNGRDQICFEEPRKVRLVLGDKDMQQLKTGIEKSIMNLKQFRAFG